MGAEHSAEQSRKLVAGGMAAGMVAQMTEDTAEGMALLVEVPLAV